MIGKLPINIEDLLRQRTVEGERIEYKKGWNPDAVVRTICAFANDFHNLGGGYIVIGVADDCGRPELPPAGLSAAGVDRIQKEILNFGHNAIRPQYHPLSAHYVVDGRSVLVLWAPGGQSRPYKARKSVTGNDSDWAYYVRKSSSTVQAKGEEEQDLLSLAATVPFDDRYNQGATLENISLHLVKEFLESVGSDLAGDVDELPIDDLGRQMNIAGGPTEQLFPKNIGLLFFNEEPHAFFPATQVDVVWFPDGAGGDRFDEKIFKGPLDRVVRDAVSFVERSYIKETVIKHPHKLEAERLWNFPLAVVKEAVANAIYHRSYEIREPVEIRVSPEDLVVLSFPGPDRSIRLEDLREGHVVSRRYRNRRIGEFLKELDLTEGRSTGLGKIFRAMARNGSPKPEFETDDDRSYFLIRLPVHPKARGADAFSHLDSGSRGNSSRVDGGASRPESGHSRDEARVLELCRPGTGASLAEIQAAMGRSNRSKFRNQILKPLLDAGMIEMTVPDKPRSGKQKYRITDMGRRLLEETRE